MEYRVSIKTESFCEVSVEAKSIKEVVNLVQDGDFINDSRCSGYFLSGIIQNIESIEDEDGNDVLRTKKVML